jgi:hypothetical protein
LDKSRNGKAAAERKLEAAFTALEAELDALVPATKAKGARAIGQARSALSMSVAKLRQAVGKV